MSKFSTPRGTQDILPDDWIAWNFVLEQAAQVARLHGYRRIETPTFGPTSLFARASGEGTDIVDKEMYSFQDRGGDELTLRPEGTAPVMRAYFQHGMNKWVQPVKLYYVERMYRYDRPQRGRWREHHQFGCEAIGSSEPYVDVEMIALLSDFYHRIGLSDLILHLNSIGDSACRPMYISALVSYLRQHHDALAERDRERLERNPLRVLDSKEFATQPLLVDAPVILDYLCDACRYHWERVRHGLDMLGIRYRIDARLVRGLDYYTRTAFEFIPDSDRAQATVGGGGRYDALSTTLGGPLVPGVGFGTGIERLILNIEERGLEVPRDSSPDVFFVHVGKDAEDQALRLAELCRQANVVCDVAYGSRSLKAQMKHANSSGAAIAAIVGEDELQQGAVTLRHLVSGEQRMVAWGDVVEVLKDMRR